jgi:predicted DNA-binding protein YlxM (UPF0122 family)
MEETKDIELIDRYLKNDLSSKEREYFNIRLAEDTSFNELYQFINNLRVVTKVKGREEILEKVNDLFEESSRRAEELKKSKVKIVSIKSVFENFSIKPTYAIAASLLILIISSIILVIIFKKTTNTEKITLNKAKSEMMRISNVDSVIYLSKSLPLNAFLTKNIINKEFGFVSIESKTLSPILIKILSDKAFNSKYILCSDTLILLGNFEINNLKKIFNFPGFYVMNYSAKYYRMKKIERKILPLREESDSAIIKATLKP